MCLLQDEVLPLSILNPENFPLLLVKILCPDLNIDILQLPVQEHVIEELINHHLTAIEPLRLDRRLELRSVPGLDIASKPTDILSNGHQRGVEHLPLNRGVAPEIAHRELLTIELPIKCQVSAPFAGKRNSTESVNSLWNTVISCFLSSVLSSTLFLSHFRKLSSPRSSNV